MTVAQPSAMSIAAHRTDPFAAETLPHFAELRRAARRITRSDAADDLVQETFLRAFAARDRFLAGSNARAWLYRILTNTAYSAHRKSMREARMQERYSVEPQPFHSGDRLDATTRARLLSAVAALPESHRSVLVLADVEGLSYQEIASRLAVPMGTVMSRLHRARRRLRVVLGDSERPDGATVAEEPSMGRLQDLPRRAIPPR